MPNHAGVLQSLFFPAKLETEGDGSIFNTLLDGSLAGDALPIDHCRERESSIGHLEHPGIH